jgi:hypothetical protein
MQSFKKFLNEKSIWKEGTEVSFKGKDVKFKVAYVDDKKKKYYASNLKDYINFGDEHLWEIK